MGRELFIQLPGLSSEAAFFAGIGSELWCLVVLFVWVS